MSNQPQQERARGSAAESQVGESTRQAGAEFQQVLLRIRELARERELLGDSPIAPSELTEHHHLVEDLQLDSIELLSLAVEVENEFQVAFSEEDDENIRTVGDLVRSVCEHRAAQERSGDQRTTR